MAESPEKSSWVDKSTRLLSFRTFKRGGLTVAPQKAPGAPASAFNLEAEDTLRGPALGGKAPVQYIDLRTGDRIIATSNKFYDPKRYRKVDASGNIELHEAVEQGFEAHTLAFYSSKNSGEIKIQQEVGTIGYIWRYAVKLIMLASMDRTNALRLTRGYQLLLPFLTSYESFLLGQLIIALDKGDAAALNSSLAACFRNRNVSRIIIQQLGRFDYFWHFHHSLRFNRAFSAWAVSGSIPLIGPWIDITSFPASENFNGGTRDWVVAGILRHVFGPGRFWTRIWTGNRQALLTDNDNVVAQNLAAEGTGFEIANRNVHGTAIGRERTNAFRYENRLPTDESVLRTFITTPLSTMLNNGIEHTLGIVAGHVANMLYQTHGNFAHQRMEQLNPIEMMRFHLPVIFIALTTFRGLSRWDAQVLGPFVKKLQRLSLLKTVDPARELLNEMRTTIVERACAGVPSRIIHLSALTDALDDALTALQEEAEAVRAISESVTDGMAIGDLVMRSNGWRVPKLPTLRKAVLAVIKKKEPPRMENVAVPVIHAALGALTPKDKRTLIELCTKGHASSRAATLLLTRTATILQRLIRRERLDTQLTDLSYGRLVTSPDDFKQSAAYWLVDTAGTKDVYIYLGKKDGRNVYRFAQRAERTERDIEFGSGSTYSNKPAPPKVYEYVEAAEAITRAQKAAMTIELDLGKRFSFDAFMEFDHLRSPLRVLLVLQQLQCHVLDDARLNVLQGIQHGDTTEVALADVLPGNTYFKYTNQQYEPFTAPHGLSVGDATYEELRGKKITVCPPQSVLVVGGGPTGLITTLHCLENVLRSDGHMRLYESRDAFLQAGATFERSQVVRLDPRWIAMLRYHLGTLFEDIWIPAAGETDPHDGNTLPAAGFIEITIKNMEAAMHLQVAKLLSRGLLQHDTQAGAQYSADTNKLEKKGRALKIDDLVLRKFDPSGASSVEQHTWRITSIQYGESLAPSELTKGKHYAVYVSARRAIFEYILIAIDAEVSPKAFRFRSLDPQVADITAFEGSFPSVYPEGTAEHASVLSLGLTCEERHTSGSYAKTTLQFKDIANLTFELDLGHTHVVEAIGKPANSKVHFRMTTSEPYGVCCMSGLQISLNMHSFGNRRWQNDLVDDIRSHTDQNMRLIGDFTKVVNSGRVAAKMVQVISKDVNWKLHWEKLAADLGVEAALPDIHAQLVAKCKELAAQVPFRRPLLQTRFFETGDNFYLGMEFNREYDTWKKGTILEFQKKAGEHAAGQGTDPALVEKQKRAMGGTLNGHIDRLWYDACLEVIRKGDVYNPGGRSFVPRQYTIDSYTDQKLGELPVGNAFRVKGNPANRYEVLQRNFGGIVVRDVEGYVSTLPKSTVVRRGGNLTRAPDGNTESKVSIATFPVAHYINHRTMRLANATRGYVFAFAGDEQCSPHFMRYSGLTGACVNCMLFSNFIGDAILGADFKESFARYSAETNWSNGEVVTRGTGANYGEDGLVRPGYVYLDGCHYLRSKIIEYRESGQSLDKILLRDWKQKFTAAIVPRGLEYNDAFISKLVEKLQTAILECFVSNAEADPELKSVEGLGKKLMARAKEMGEHAQATPDYWTNFLAGLDVPSEAKPRLADPHTFCASKLLEFHSQIVAFARWQFRHDARVSSLLEKQPPAVESHIDDFAVEAQGFTNSLTNAVSFGALASSLGFVSMLTGSATIPLALILGSAAPWAATATITNVSRYKNRNEDWRVAFKDHKYDRLLIAVYSQLGPAERKAIDAPNPFLTLLERQVRTFVRDVSYYDYDEPIEFRKSFANLMANTHDPLTIVAFMDEIATKYAVETYYVNSFLQENLVRIYTTCEEMLSVESGGGCNAAEGRAAAAVLFERLALFGTRLETSLQRGVIRYGYSKKRVWKHTHVATLFWFFYQLLWLPANWCTCGYPTSKEAAKRAAGGWFKPVNFEAHRLHLMTESLANLADSPSVRRGAMDLQSLYFAGRESTVSTLIILAGFTIFYRGIIFIIGEIGMAAGAVPGPDGVSWADNVARVSQWIGSIDAPAVALLASWHLSRKIWQLGGCYLALQRKKRAGSLSAAAKRVLRTVGCIDLTQVLITLIRIVAVLSAAAAGILGTIFRENPGRFNFSLGIRQSGEEGQQGALIPNALSPLLAAGAVGLQLIALIFRFMVEYSILYKLDTKLGEFVCTAFEDELSEMARKLEIDRPSTVTQQAAARTKWRYVARWFVHRYRFDTIFLADRFGSIFHYVQSGLSAHSADPSEKSIGPNESTLKRGGSAKFGDPTFVVYNNPPADAGSLGGRSLGGKSVRFRLAIDTPLTIAEASAKPKRTKMRLDSSVAVSVESSVETASEINEADENRHAAMSPSLMSETLSEEDSTLTAARSAFAAIRTIEEHQEEGSAPWEIEASVGSSELSLPNAEKSIWGVDAPSDSTEADRARKFGIERSIKIAESEISFTPQRFSMSL